MADEPINVPDTPHAPAGIQAHKCEHTGCSKWGGFGFSRGRSSATVWYCNGHRGDGEAYLGRPQQ
jgi:hypothetical protein